MIGRSVNRAGRVTVSMLTLVLIASGFVTHPEWAVAAGLDAAPAAHVVIFQSQGTQTQHVTYAQTVGSFLRERGIAPAANDYVHPDVNAPLVDNLVVEYRAAVPVTIVTGSIRKTVRSSASSVAALLSEQGVDLGQYDIVHPSLSHPLVANATIRVARVLQWFSSQKHHIAQRTIHRIDFSLPPGKTKVIKPGFPGLTITMVDNTQTDGKIRSRVVERRTVREPQARIVAEGVATSSGLTGYALRGLQKTSYVASEALEMVATAYTAQCPGCSGYTASGYHAGRGVVAVDPRLIPLGTKLFIPGYGFAIAGDTGGAIVGRRIDLGFNTLGDAMSFGRRTVKVYTLR